MTMSLRNWRIRLFAAPLALLTLAGVSACGDRADGVQQAPESVEAGLVTDGRAIAEAQCARCHAIGVTGQSPRADAPPLRTVLATYAPEALAEDFREGIHVGHRDMPDFDFGPTGTDAILAYLVSIQETDASE